MNVLMLLFMIVLFYCLIPGMFFTLPPNGSKMTVALTHAVIFALIWYLLHHKLWEMTQNISFC